MISQNWYFGNWPVFLHMVSSFLILRVTTEFLNISGNIPVIMAWLKLFANVSEILSFNNLITLQLTKKSLE